VICGHCKKAETTDGRKWCDRCRENHARAHKARYDKAIAAGLCPRCNDELAPGLKSCASCAGAARKSQAGYVRRTTRRRIERKIAALRERIAEIERRIESHMEDIRDMEKRR